MTTTTAKRYCRSCPPGRPTILSMYNPEDYCFPCIAARTEAEVEVLRKQMAAREKDMKFRPASYDRESLIDLIVRTYHALGRWPTRDEMAVGAATFQKYGPWGDLLQAARDVIAGGQVTSRRRQIINSLRSRGEMTCVELAAALELTPRIVLRVVEKMRTVGLVDRALRENSKGSYSYWLTEKGEGEQ